MCTRDLKSSGMFALLLPLDFLFLGFQRLMLSYEQVRQISKDLQQDSRSLVVMETRKFSSCLTHHNYKDQSAKAVYETMLYQLNHSHKITKVFSKKGQIS